MIDYRCPKCNDPMSSPSSMAGQEEACPNCGSVAVVPQGGGQPLTHGELVGNIDAICPHCGCALEKKPGKKKKCPNCGQFIYVRTRPSDRKKVLVTEAQAEHIAEQWFIVRGGTHDEYVSEQRRLTEERKKLAERFAEERARLTERWGGTEPSDNDVRWSLLNDELLEHMRSRNWGLYRNTKLGMGNILRKEGKLTEALGFYLEVCYLDLNGPRNTGGYAGDHELLREYPPWDPKSELSLDLTGVAALAAGMIWEANLSLVAVEDIYRRRASALHTELHLPLSPATVWPRIGKALSDQDGGEGAPEGGGQNQGAQ